MTFTQEQLVELSGKSLAEQTGYIRNTEVKIGEEIPNDAWIVFRMENTNMELRLGNAVETLFWFNDKQNGFYHVLMYLLTRNGFFSSGEVGAIIDKVKAITGLVSFSTLSEEGIARELKALLESTERLQQVFTVTINTKDKVNYIQITSTVRPLIEYEFKGEHLYIYDLQETGKLEAIAHHIKLTMIGEKNKDTYLAKEDNVHALFVLIQKLEAVLRASTSEAEQWMRSEDLQAHLGEQGIKINVAFLVQKFKQNVRVLARNFIEEKSEGTGKEKQVWYRLNPCFTAHEDAPVFPDDKKLVFERPQYAK